MAIINKIELPDGEVYDLRDEGAKRIQTAINSPDASGNATAFIDTISQDTNGVITATKKTIPAASTSTAGLLSAADKTKLDSVESGAQPNAVSSVNSKTGAVVLDATDVGAIKSDLSYNIASYPYTGSEVLLLHNPTTGNNTVTDVATFLSSATGGGGGGSGQGALVHYTKTVSLAVSSTSQTFNDENITASMVVIEYTFSNPAAQGSDLTITTADGSVTIAGTITEATNLTLYFGVSVSVPPTIQVNLGSNSTANILNASVNPGVFGTLGRGNGGTGVIATDLADLRDKLGITPENIGAVAITGSTKGIMTGPLTMKDNRQHYWLNSAESRFWIIYPSASGDEFYIATQEVDAQGQTSNWKGVLVANSDGTIALNQPLAVTAGGTGARNVSDALANLGAVAKSGDTMTGNLGIKAAWPSIQFFANGGTQETGTITSHRDNGRIYITEHSTDGTKEEYYQLPIADGTGTYNILTSKSAVSIPQGGTGATTLASAQANLGIPVVLFNNSSGGTVVNVDFSKYGVFIIGLPDNMTTTARIWGTANAEFWSTASIYAGSNTPVVFKSYCWKVNSDATGFSINTAKSYQINFSSTGTPSVYQITNDKFYSVWGLAK